MLTHWLLTLKLFVNHDADDQIILTMKQIHSLGQTRVAFFSYFLACSLFSYFFSFSNEKRLPQKERESNNISKTALEAYRTI